MLCGVVLMPGLATAACCTSIGGQVGTVETLGSGAGAPNNLDFRIYLVGNPVICNGNSWAYINTTDANYQALVANLLTAKAAGFSVTLAISQDGSGYCQIAYMFMN
jgi:hypothetical protein